MSIVIEERVNRPDRATIARGEGREQAIREFAPIIKVLARRMAAHLPASLDVNDLESAGTIGLMDAMDRYDPTKGATLKTYAEIRIHGAMVDELRAHDWMPRRVRRAGSQIQKAQVLLQARYGRPATDEELSSELQMSQAELQEYLLMNQEGTHCSIEDLVFQDKNGQDVPEQMIDDTGTDPLSSAIATNLREFLGKHIEELPQQERLVLTLYYYEELTLREIAGILALTESRICQIHGKAIRTLKIKLESVDQLVA